MTSPGISLVSELAAGQTQWPRPNGRDGDFITSTDYSCAAGAMYSKNWVWGTGAGWPTTNRAFYFPYLLRSSFTVSYAWWLNGSAVSGKVDAGIYDRNGTRLVSVGAATNQAGTTAIQSVDITDTILTPGVYYLALVMDNTTGRLWRSNTPENKDCRAAGMMMQDTAFALPATATFTANTAGLYYPMFGFSTRSTV